MTGTAAIAELPLGAEPMRVVSLSPGFPRFPYRDTIISQYANSPILTSLIDSMAEWLNPAARLDEFYALVFNVDTAIGYGLDVWGRIVGVSRVLQVPAGGFLGFASDSDAEPFGSGIWYGAAKLTSNYSLTDEAYRKLIFAKTLLNITNASIPAINQILLNLFGQYGDVYVIDNQDMTLSYMFPVALSPVDYAIVTQSGVLPRPIGVQQT